MIVVFVKPDISVSSGWVHWPCNGHVVSLANHVSQDIMP
jgi:hypothetical protein